MVAIDKIDKQIVFWEKQETVAKNKDFAKGVQLGLLIAYRYIINEPSNKDDSVCVCDKDEDDMVGNGYWYCPWCGKKLEQD